MVEIEHDEHDAGRSGQGAAGDARRVARRAVLRAGVAATAGGLVWSAPVVTTSDRASAAPGSPRPGLGSLTVRTDCTTVTSTGSPATVRYPDTDYRVTLDTGVQEAGVDLRLEFIYDPPEDGIASGVLTTDAQGRAVQTFGPYTNISHGPKVRLRAVRVDDGQVLGIVDLVFADGC